MYSTAQWPLTNTVNFSCRDCPVHPLLVAQSERQAKTEDSFVVCFFILSREIHAVLSIPYPGMKDELI